MQYQKNDVEEAFALFVSLLKNGIIEKDDSENLKRYRNQNIRMILSEVVEPQSNAKIFDVDGKIYLVPNLDNVTLSYSNEELKKRLGFKNNEQIYLFHFVVIIVLSQFYNSEDQSLSVKQFVRVETIQSVLKKHIAEFKNYSETQLENQTVRTELDIIGIVNAWDSLPEYNEKAKNINSTKKNQVGFILHVLRFLESEDLLWVREDNEISITEKMNTLIINYYYNTQRKEKLLTLFK